MGDCSFISHLMLTIVLHRTLGIIKPDALRHMGRILDAVWQSGFQITRMKTMILERTEAGEFYKEFRHDNAFK